MFRKLKSLPLLKRLRKQPFFSRLRQRLLSQRPTYVDDFEEADGAERIQIDWPPGVPKPRCGIVRDHGPFPRWTRYRRLLEYNSFPYDIYDIHALNWASSAGQYGVVVGFVSSDLPYLQELQNKYHFLEQYLGIATYPSLQHALLWENKFLESYVAAAHALPFADTYIFHNREEALARLDQLPYPLVSKIVPGSGSVGVQFVRSPDDARKIIRRAFSCTGRPSHVPYMRQKDYVYFQKYVPNDGFDIRVIVVGNHAFGHYRKVLQHDFRASGMDQMERRELPVEAMMIARSTNEVVKSPMLAVDMVHGLDGKYQIIEFSPMCRIRDSEYLHVDHVPGMYEFDKSGSVRFVPGRFWVHELALKEFLVNDYLERVHNANR